jgi:hypothetical protein
MNKVFIVSGLTNSTTNSITLTCNNVCNINLLSGTIIGTTRSEKTTNICMYNINIWTFVNIDDLGITTFNLGYNSLSPINTNNQGDWYIENITIDQPNDDSIFNINILCNGSSNTDDNIIWGFKIDVFSI